MFALGRFDPPHINNRRDARHASPTTTGNAQDFLPDRCFFPPSSPARLPVFTVLLLNQATPAPTQPRPCRSGPVQPTPPGSGLKLLPNQRHTSLVHLVNGRRRAVGLLLPHDRRAVRLADGHVPAELVLELAQLDALERRQKLEAGLARVLLARGDVRHRLLARLGAADPLVLLGREGLRRGRVHAARDGADRHQGGGGARGHDFGEGGELAVLDLYCVMLSVEGPL